MSAAFFVIGRVVGLMFWLLLGADLLDARRAARRGDLQEDRRRRPGVIDSSRLQALSSRRYDIDSAAWPIRQARRIQRSPPRRPHLPAVRRLSRARASSRTTASTPRRSAIPKRSGRGLPASSSGRGRGTACSTGSRRTRSGSSAGQLNASVNCVDRHVARAAPQQGGDHLGRRAGRSPHAHLLRPLPRGLDSSPMS